MLHPKLGRAMNLVYFHALVFALLGTTLRIRSWRRTVRLEKLSWTYLLYSVFLSSTLFLNMYFLFPKAILDGYIKSNIILQGNFFMMTGLRVMALLGCYGTIWVKRKEIIGLYEDALSYWKKHRSLLRGQVDRKDLKELQLSLARKILTQILVSYTTTMFSTVIQYQLLGVVNKFSLMALAARISHFFHFVAFKVAFYGVLILLENQFGVVHLALDGLHNRKDKKRVSALRSIAAMHWETFQLARRIFALCDIANAALFINMFMTTVNILYHAVQFSNETIKSSIWGIVFGNGLIIFNFWGTMMMMNMLDKVVSSCNNVGKHLKQFSDLPRVSKSFQRGLDIFTMEVRRNRLVYKICGLVELDKPACLSYIGSVLTQVIILMQFDLRQNNQPHQHTYLTQLSRNTSEQI
ncbi:hypothetical protein KR026_004213 [Drosophila bipectinata]|nr:hypothetical protein KR026_004213 [Drosophila bipectinata]